MKTYKTASRAVDWASQSRVVHSTRPMPGRSAAFHRWSVQLLRRRSRHGAVERRGWTLFVSAGRLRGEVGTR